MISSSTQGNSEHALMDQLMQFSDAGGSIIQIRTREPMRAAVTLRKHLIGSESPHHEWDTVNGWRNFTAANFTDHQINGDKSDFIAALERPLNDLRAPGSALRGDTEKVHYYVFVDPHLFMTNNPYASELVMQYAAILPSTNACILFITGEEPIPGIGVGNILVADFQTPNAQELRAVLERIVEDGLTEESAFTEQVEFTEEETVQIAHLGLGLTLYEFETYAALTVVEASIAEAPALTPAMLLEGIGKGKTAVIRQSEILELNHATDINEVGGMHRLKDWVSVRKDSYSDEAREFGVEPPKGMALVGVPGTGKSLVAKAVAGVFGVPLVRLDIARVFSKYVGDSESRMLAALKMVASMAPCVLFVDEIDKGLGGAGGGGDSGTSSRVLGSFLTWLQENDAPVFTVVTMNRVSGLPPELLRKGRFDAIFSVGMPNDESRREVFSIHLKKRSRSLDDFTPAEISEFIKASTGFVPAEIEAVVKDGITLAFSDAKATKLEMRHLLSAIKETVPMSKSHAESIQQITEWASQNATPVEYTVALPDPKKAAAEAAAPPRATGRVIRPGRSAR